jgi:hypothetical protein
MELSAGLSVDQVVDEAVSVDETVCGPSVDQLVDAAVSVDDQGRLSDASNAMLDAGAAAKRRIGDGGDAMSAASVDDEGQVIVAGNVVSGPSADDDHDVDVAENIYNWEEDLSLPPKVNSFLGLVGAGSNREAGSVFLNFFFSRWFCVPLW